MERFLQEAKVQSSLVHRNIVALHAFFREAGYECMVMEYAEGITLKNLIEQLGQIPEQRALHIFRQLLQAVGYAHMRGIVHRDIKPSNVVVGTDDTVKVMDFGIAKILGDQGMTRTGAKLGTLHYMSPEQVKAAKDIDHRTDLYSMGVTLYEMLTGQMPINVNTESDFEIMREILEGEVPDPRSINPNITVGTSALLMAMMAKERELRPRSCSSCEETLFHPPTSMQLDETEVQEVKTEQAVRRRVRKRSPGKPGMVLVRGGTFIMGSRRGVLDVFREYSADDDESPSHHVTLRSFYLDICPVTVAEYRSFCKSIGKNMPSRPAWGWIDDHPIVNVSWNDAVAYAHSIGRRCLRRRSGNSRLQVG